MLHSTVTKKGQTTIPGEVRTALDIQAGDRLEYKVEGNRVVVRVHTGTSSLAGALASTKGKGLSFAKIRKAAQSAAKKRQSS